LKFIKSKGLKINNKKLIRIKSMRNIIEIVSLGKKSTGLDNIQKISRTEYVIRDSGEILEYKLSQNKSENIASLKKTFHRARDLINNNFEGNANELHVTLTYAENMVDKDRLYKDFEAFWKRFKRAYGKNIDYLSIVEPQERGAWHCHVLIRFNDVDKVYIPNADIANIWGLGFTKTKATAGVDNMGAYITAYLTDVELTEENILGISNKSVEVKTVEIDGEKKRFVKGARIHLYPSGMNIIRSSKGIIYPSIEEMTYAAAKKIVGDCPPNYSSTTKILNDDDKLLNQITYEHYNLRRK
jgi:hypothetical protein